MTIKKEILRLATFYLRGFDGEMKKTEQILVKSPTEAFAKAKILGDTNDHKDHKLEIEKISVRTLFCSITPKYESMAPLHIRHYYAGYHVKEKDLGSNKLFYSDEKKAPAYWHKVPKGSTIFNPEDGKVLVSTTKKGPPTRNFRLKNLITVEQRKAPAP